MSPPGQMLRLLLVVASHPSAHSPPHWTQLGRPSLRTQDLASSHTWLPRQGFVVASPTSAYSSPHWAERDLPNLRTQDLARDHTWLPVQRMSTRCLVYKARHWFPEGLGNGYGGDSGDKYLASSFPRAAEANSTWPYGCWFIRVETSDVLVNVRRSLRASNYGEVIRKMWHPGTPHPSMADVAARIGPKSRGIVDKLWCLRALELGYDSIQIARAKEMRWPEVIICYGTCSWEPIYGACPGLAVPLRSTNSSLPCLCDDKAAKLINCGSASLRHLPLDLTGCDAAKSHITSLVTDACNESESMAASSQKRSFPTCAQCDPQKWHQCCNLTMIDEQGHCRLVVLPPGTPALPWEYLG